MGPLHTSDDNVPEQQPGLQQTGSKMADDFDVILLGPMEERKGSRLGDTRVRITLPARQPFHRLREGTLEATEAAEMPKGRMRQAGYWLKRALIGVPIATARADQERLTKFKALAVLSSDAISSVAFATEAILINLVAAGSAALGWTLPISLVILALLVVVTLSYRQTIPAYPNGGGSYIVARENLGTIPGLVAAAALMIDYVLNVAVCVAAGVHNVVSLFPSLQPYVIAMDLALVLIMTVLNLRGIRESGTIFALPTYFFIVSAFLLIGVGLTKAYVFNHQPLIGHFVPTVQAIEPLTIFILLRSFATGCSAMTGVEAISNGIPIFRKPETRNASITLTTMACILGALFLGITLLAMTYATQAEPSGNPTVIAKIASNVFAGPLVFLFPIFQLSVLGILTLSAETSYADFPRLASLLARDKFLPSMFSFRGDRLAFSSGIIALALLAGLLLVAFKGDTNALINLFAVGVFIAFTLSQSGMVVHWWRRRASHKGWLRSMIINGSGALTTALVAIIVAIAKFVEGAWIVVILIPIMVWLFQNIARHYHHVEQERTFDLPLRPQDIHHRVIIPIDRLDQATIQSLAYARSIASHVTAVHIDVDEGHSEQLRADWERWQRQIPADESIHLLIIASPFRSLIRPLLAYIDVMHQRHPEDTLTVILPEFVVSHWWEYPLHNQTALRLKTSLFFRPGIAVLNLPQHLRTRLPEGAAHHNHE